MGSGGSKSVEGGPPRSVQQAKSYIARQIAIDPDHAHAAALHIRRAARSNTAMDDRLLSAAYDLCLEMRDDPGWHDAMNRVADIEAIAELRRRCPGYSDEEYDCAIATGMMNSR